MPQSQRKYQLLAKWAWLNFLWIIFVWKVINKPCIKGKLTSAFYKKNDSLRSHFSLSLSLWLNPKKTKKYRWMYLRAEFVNSQTPIIIKLWILRNNDFTVWNTQSCSFFPFFNFDVLFFFFFLLSLSMALSRQPPNSIFWAVFQVWCPLLFFFSGCCPKKVLAKHY